jgi:hypothetical protein
MPAVGEYNFPFFHWMPPARSPMLPHPNRSQTVPGFTVPVRFDCNPDLDTRPDPERRREKWKLQGAVGNPPDAETE